MIQIKQSLLSALDAVLTTLLSAAENGTDAKPAVQFENTRTPEHGDLAITAAMQLAKPLKQNPRAIAQSMVDALMQQPAFAQWVEKCDIAGPGFINLYLKPAAKQAIVHEVLEAGGDFGRQPDNGQKIMVEFVSANPTGPLHVGHGRQAALGDAICNLFGTQGWHVHREFYYNDAGVQIHNLGLSVQARAKGIDPDHADWPEAGYRGDYIADIATAFKEKASVEATDRKVTASGNIDDLQAITDFAVAYLRNEQDLDLKAFALQFDQYYLESSLYTEGKVEAAVETLGKAGKTYEKDGALWLRSTDYGDDKDRVMRKSDGNYTYFVPDVAYHLTKWGRGYTRAVNIQGTDHHGTIARVRAGLQAANPDIPASYPDYVLHTMVRVMRGGEEVKISKRSGSYVTLRDLIDWTSKDAVRFFLLSRKPDTEYTFDVDLAVEKNNENPVYYVQYAHARIRKILRDWTADNNANGGAEGSWEKQLADADLSPLTSNVAQQLLLQLAKYPDMLTLAAQDFAPHDVCFYLRDLASSYHSYYDAERILADDEATRQARLALVAATATVLRNGLAILGVDAPESM